MRKFGTTQANSSDSASWLGGVLQRKCSCGNHTIAGGGCAECENKRGALQRKASNSEPANDVAPIVHEVLSSPGQPLDTATRAFMEPRFGHDFSRVRVHSDAHAAKSSEVGLQRQVATGGDDPKKEKAKTYGPYVLPEVVVTATRSFPSSPSVDTGIQEKMQRFSVREVTFVKVETVEEMFQRFDALNKAATDQFLEDQERRLGTIKNADPVAEQQAADAQAQDILKKQFGEGWGTFFWWTRGGGQTGQDSPLWGILEGVSGFNRAAPIPLPGVDPVYRDRTRQTHEIEAGK
jgi:hypothetical protein